MVQTHLVKLIGWCHDSWGNPSNLKGGVEPLETLARAVLEKRCRFVRITRQEADEHMKRIEVGEALTPNKVDREFTESIMPPTAPPTHPANTPITSPARPTVPSVPPTYPANTPITSPARPTVPSPSPTPRVSEITDNLIDPCLRDGEGEYFIVVHEYY